MVEARTASNDEDLLRLGLSGIDQEGAHQVPYCCATAGRSIKIRQDICEIRESDGSVESQGGHKVATYTPDSKSECQSKVYPAG
jgi:hypothetical protein